MFPYTAEEALRHMQLARLGRCPPFEWQRRNKDGSLHWDEVRLKPAMLDGRPHLLAFSREITAQKQALEDLRVREEQYRAIFESSQDGLFMWDENLRVVDVNPAGLAIYGYRREDIIGRSLPAQHARGLRARAAAAWCAARWPARPSTWKPPCCGRTAPPSTPTCGSCRSCSAASRTR